MLKSSSLHRWGVISISIAFFFFAFYIFFFHLSTPKLDNWDEAWYGQMTKEMMQTKEYFVPHWNYGVRLDKPPLQIWLDVLISERIGLSELSIRLVSAISALILVYFVTKTVFTRWGLVPAFFAFTSLILNDVFVWRARSGNLDLLPTLLIFLTYLCMLKKERSRFIFLGILFGLIYLAKASLVMFPLSVFLFHEVIWRRTSIKKNLTNYVKLFSITAIIIACWLVPGYLHGGKEFLLYYLFQSDQGVSGLSLRFLRLDYVKYTYYALQRRIFFILVLGIALSLRRIRKPEFFLLIVFSTALIALLSLTERNNNWYLLPAMPFWSVAVGFGVAEIIRLTNKAIVTFQNVIVAKSVSSHPAKMLTFVRMTESAFLVCFILIGIVISYRTYTINISPILTTHSAFEQAESGKKIETLTTPQETIVRMDHLYPSTLYYSSRKVLASPRDADTRDLFISRADLYMKLKKHKLSWLIGTKGDIEDFKKTYADIQLETVSVTATEMIAKVL